MTTPPYQPQITVRMKLLSTERGGRTEDVPAGEYRGTFSARGQHFSIRCEAPPAGLKLGETTVLDVEFLFPALALPFFKDKGEFNVWEGGIVGYGRVMKVLTPA